MEKRDCDVQEKRITEYRRLEKLHGEIFELIDKIGAGDPSGPCGQGPFTGNTRESRRIVNLTIDFSPTRGGAPAVSMCLGGLHIAASDFGSHLSGLLRERLRLVAKEMTEL